MYLQKKFLDRHPRRRCGHCDGEVDQITRFEIVPKVLVFATNGAPIKASKKISFYDGEKRIVFGLKGIVYTGDFLESVLTRLFGCMMVWYQVKLASMKTN